MYGIHMIQCQERSYLPPSAWCDARAQADISDHKTLIVVYEADSRKPQLPSYKNS